MIEDQLPNVSFGGDEPYVLGHGVAGHQMRTQARRAVQAGDKRICAFREIRQGREIAGVGRENDGAGVAFNAQGKAVGDGG